MAHQHSRSVVVALLVLAALVTSLTPVVAQPAATTDPSVAPASDPVAPRATSTLDAIRDSWVEIDRPDRNFGDRPALSVRRDPSAISLVRFRIPPGTNNIDKVVLRLRVKSPGAARLIVRETSNAWGENQVTWRNRPPLGDAIAARNIGAGGRRWAAVDVSDHITGPGTYSLALSTRPGERLVFMSREGQVPPALVVTTNAPPPPSGSVTFAAAGDYGKTSATNATLNSIGQSDAEFLLALGDLAYGDASETQWCNYVKGRLGNQFPVQLVVGNHEDDDRPDGVHINQFAACLPDRMNSSGQYARQYYFDVGPLARVIMIGADNEVNGVHYDYDVGTTHYNWLRNAIDGARSAGKQWVIVGMHKVCVSAGNKPCEVGADLYKLLLNKKVDLILHGHEHDYQRSKQLTCVTPGQYRPGCVADDGSDNNYPRGAGSVFVINGNAGGGGLTDIDQGDPEFQSLAAWHGANSPDPGRGHLLIDANTNRMVVEFIGTTTSYTDRFVIR